MPEQEFNLSLAALASESQRLEDQGDNARWFALYMGVHYSKRGAAGGALGKGKPAPPSLSQDVLEYIISNEKRAKALKTVRKSDDKRAKDLATLLPTQDRNLRSRGAKPTHKGGGPIKQPGGGFRGN